MADVLQYEGPPLIPPAATWLRRWLLVLILIGWSFSQDLLIVFVFSAPGSGMQVLREIVGTFALGPFSSYRLGRDVPVNPPLTALALALIASRPLKPSAWTALAAIGGFVLWRALVQLLP
jgi:hypothetical protein